MLQELTEDQKEAVKEKTEKEIVLTEKKVRIQDALLQYESINKKQETLNKFAEEIKKYLNHARIIKEKNEILQNKNEEIIEFLKQHEDVEICINECRNKKQQTEEKMRQPFLSDSACRFTFSLCTGLSSFYRHRDHIFKYFYLASVCCMYSRCNVPCVSSTERYSLPPQTRPFSFFT